MTAPVGAAERLRAHAELMRQSAQVLVRMHGYDPAGGYGDTAIQRELDADADDAGAAALGEVATLRAEREQLANFNPDWDILAATRDSLREHMAEVLALRARLTQMEAALREIAESGHNHTSGSLHEDCIAVAEAALKEK